MGDRQTNGGQTGICFGSGMSFGVEADEKTRVGLSRKSFGSEIGLVIEFGVRFIRDEVKERDTSRRWQERKEEGKERKTQVRDCFGSGLGFMLRTRLSLFFLVAIWVKDMMQGETHMFPQVVDVYSSFSYHCSSLL